MTQSRTLCRICAQEKEGLHFTDLYDASKFVRGQPNLYTMLRAVCPPVFEKPDVPGMPTNVCAVCRNSTIAAYKLHKLCIESDRRLVEMCVVVQDPAESIVVVKGEVEVEPTKLHDSMGENSDENEENKMAQDVEKIKSTEKKQNEDFSFKRTCKICLGDFPTLRDMLNHMKKAHPHVECGAAVSKLSNKPKQISEAKHRCKLCADMFRTKNGLTAHIKNSHPESCFICDTCKKIFFSASDLEKHQEIHYTGEKYECDICKKRFKFIQSLKVHRTIHFGPYPCPTCGKVFTMLANRKLHMKRHEGIKRFACTVCSNRFFTAGERDFHMVAHTKQRDYICETCGSQFTKSLSLKHHVERVHLKMRNVICSICDMKLFSAGRLKRHMYTHTGEKPYRCPFCQRDFNQTNDLVKHARSHVDGPFGCDRCGETFRLMGDLRDHYGPAHVATGEQVDELRWTTVAALSRLVAKMQKDGRKWN